MQGPGHRCPTDPDVLARPKGHPALAAQRSALGVLPLLAIAAFGGFLLNRLADWTVVEAALPLVAVLVIAVPLALMVPVITYRTGAGRSVTTRSTR